MRSVFSISACFTDKGEVMSVETLSSWSTKLKEMEAVPEVEAIDEGPSVDASATVLGLVEVLLKEPVRSDRLHRAEGLQAHLIPRFLAIALGSNLLFALAMLVILNAAPAASYPERLLAMPRAGWHDGSGWGMVAAYLIGLIAAACICLPSFYFFALLAGVRMTMLQIAGQVVRCNATSALALFGILPIYVAVILGLIIFKAPTEFLEYGLYLGLVLPFIAGLEGVRAIYRGVLSMADTLPLACRQERLCFFRRLTFSWALCYTAVAPVMIYRLWDVFASL
jgi:hypothetical protein